MITGAGSPGRQAGQAVVASGSEHNIHIPGREALRDTHHNGQAHHHAAVNVGEQNKGMHAPASEENLPAHAGQAFRQFRYTGSATRSCPSAATMRACVKVPVFKVLLIFSGGSSLTIPSISGASA